MKNSQTQFKQTELGLIPEDWGILRFDEMARLGNEKYVPSPNANIKYIGLEHIDQQSLSLNSVGSSDNVKSIKSYFEKGDILFGKLRPYFRKLYRPKFSGVCSTDIWVVKAKEGVDQGFLYYFMANQDFVDEASSGSSGTRMPRADWKHLAKIEYSMPTLTEQKKIAGVLGALDDKIELNRKMNQTLESLGQAIFKRWFIDFEFPNAEGKPYKSNGGEMIDSELGKIPKGWKVGSLSNLVDNIKTPFRGNNLQEKYPYVPIDIISAQSLALSETSAPENAQSSLIMFNANDILFGAMRPYFHKVAIAPFCGLTRTTCFVLRPKLENLRSFSILTVFDKSTIDFATDHSEGSTIPYAKWTNGMENMRILVPNEEILNKFERLCWPILETVRNSFDEIETLSQIRDSLLPRLMSGKLRVK